MSTCHKMVTWQTKTIRCHFNARPGNVRWKERVKKYTEGETCFNLGFWWHFWHFLVSFQNLSYLDFWQHFRHFDEFPVWSESRKEIKREKKETGSKTTRKRDRDLFLPGLLTALPALWWVCTPIRVRERDKERARGGERDRDFFYLDFWRHFRHFDEFPLRSESGREIKRERKRKKESESETTWKRDRERDQNMVLNFLRYHHRRDK